jgi:hypothetical protein
MSQRHHIDFLDDDPPGTQPGDLDSSEIWWSERQEALEAAGYMLRVRYRPGWLPSWRGTKKLYFTVEDGLPISVSAFYAFPVVMPTTFRCV